MSLTTRAWVVAASVGAVEALKDQGFCRWNYVIRSIHQQAKKNMGSYLQAKRIPTSIDSSASSLVIQRRVGDEKSRQSEESLRKLIYLSCWGPNWHQRQFLFLLFFPKNKPWVNLLESETKLVVVYIVVIFAVIRPSFKMTDLWEERSVLMVLFSKFDFSFFEI